MIVMGLKEIRRLREKLAMPIQIRGTSSAFPLPEKEPGHKTVYSYRVNPRVQLSDRKFFEKFHATLAAAVARGLDHSKAYLPQRDQAYYHGEKGNPELRFSIYKPDNRSFREFRDAHRAWGKPIPDRQLHPRV